MEPNQWNSWEGRLGKKKKKKKSQRKIQSFFLSKYSLSQSTLTIVFIFKGFRGGKGVAGPPGSAGAPGFRGIQVGFN